MKIAMPSTKNLFQKTLIGICFSANLLASVASAQSYMMGPGDGSDTFRIIPTSRPMIEGLSFGYSGSSSNNAAVNQGETARAYLLADLQALQSQLTAIVTASKVPTISLTAPGGNYNGVMLGTSSRSFPQPNGLTIAGMGSLSGSDLTTAINFVQNASPEVLVNCLEKTDSTTFQLSRSKVMHMLQRHTSLTSSKTSVIAKAIAAVSAKR